MISQSRAGDNARSPCRARLRPVLGLVACCCALRAPPALAQDPAILREILVTAQRREQDIQDVPGSVIQLQGVELERRGITDATALAAIAPGLSIGSPAGAGNNPAFALRGVGFNDYSDNTTGPIAVFVDEVYQAAPAGLILPLFDVARIEVLRGPQGPLWDHHAMGGVIHVVTNRPTAEPELAGQVGASRYRGRSAQLALGGPLGARAQARVAGLVERDDGWYRNRVPGEPASRRNETDRQGLRALLNLSLSDRSSILLGAHSARSDVRAPVYGHQGTAGLRPDFGDPDGNCNVPDPAMDCFGYADADGDWFAGASDRNGALRIEAEGALLQASWRGERLALTALTGYERTDKLHAEDTDAGPAPLVEPLFTAHSRALSQELRAEGATRRLRWVGGLYHFDWEIRGVQQLALPFLTDRGLLANAFQLDSAYDQATRGSAVFGQIEFGLTDTVTLRTGLRWTHERKRYDYVQIDRYGGVREWAGLDPQPGLVLLDFDATTAGDLARISTDRRSGQLGVAWQPIADFMVFANVARGFRSGGFNAGLVALPVNPTESGVPPDPAAIRYGPEELASYELGMKWILLGGRARLHATVFHYDYDDVQTLTFSGYSSQLGNAAAATIQGAEVEFSLRPFAGLELQLGASLLDTQASRVGDPAGGAFARRELPLAPDWTLTGLARFERPTTAGSWFIQAEFAAIGPQWFDIRNQSVAHEGSYLLLGARAGLTFGPAGRYELALWGRNLGNEHYLVYSFDLTSSLGLNQQMPGPPRWYGVTFSARL